ncbi:hypothetical protein PCYB_001130 [Plasmodium cynomolgi strain B]|uniref:Pv-fam-d protein n=1 Tax=Plasmodium cynomolgi (strain B) TaxID=1120755 RepID=K6V292_PLACD|nr:hypothetical protein PCYB_001130 [Plasmodium cynomolgi strain B]GAB69365.1 hypothetical protein PCYB_001130 [Plasmodium cynomolgi strain B]
MKEKNKKFEFFLNFITFTLLILTWYYPDEGISPGKPFGQGTQSSSSLHIRTSRLLRGNIEQDVNQKYASLRESIKQLVKEDDANFKRKLISLLRDHQIDNKFISTLMKKCGELKNTDSYRKGRHPSKYENMHDKELYKSRDPNRGLKHRQSKKGFFSSLSKFLKNSDALYEQEFIKLITYDDRTSSRAKRTSGKLKLYFNIISPLLTCALFVLGSLVLYHPVVFLSSVIAYLITVFYMLYKSVIVSKKCSIQDRVNKKRRSELTAARR